MRHTLVVRAICLGGAVLVLVSCSEILAPTPTSPAAQSGHAPAVSALTAQTLLAQYVALGTSNSQGAQSAGINAAGQNAAWPAQLARLAGVAFQVPLITNPGCSPPLLPPLAADVALVALFGPDLIDVVSTTCAPLQSARSVRLASTGSGAARHACFAISFFLRPTRGHQDQTNR